MQGKTHRLGGMAAGALVPAMSIVLGAQINFTETDVMAMIAGGAIGSLIPDLDNKHGLISTKLKLTSAIVRKVTSHRGFTHTLVALLMYGVATILCGGLIERQATTKGLGLVIAIIAGTIMGTCGGYCYTVFKKITLSRVNHKYLAITTALSFLLGFTLTIYNPAFISDLAIKFLFGSVFGYASHLYLDCYTVSGVKLFAPFSYYEVHLGQCRTGSDWHNIKREDLPKKGDSQEVRKVKALARKKAKGHPGEPVYAALSVLTLACSLIVIFMGR